MDMEVAFDGLKKELAGRLRGVSPDAVVFVGVGNRLRGDDAIGPLLIDLLKGRVPHAMDAGSAPENSTSAIKRLRPRAIIFLDAARLGDVSPGLARVVNIEEVKKLGVSAHDISLDAVMEYLRESTGADVFMVGVQPERIGEGERVSPSLRRPLEELADAVAGALRG
jgi:hydrogenase 3 maturation protease